MHTTHFDEFVFGVMDYEGRQLQTAIAGRVASHAAYPVLPLTHVVRLPQQIQVTP